MSQEDEFSTKVTCEECGCVVEETLSVDSMLPKGWKIFKYGYYESYDYSKHAFEKQLCPKCCAKLENTLKEIRS